MGLLIKRGGLIQLRHSIKKEIAIKDGISRRKEEKDRIYLKVRHMATICFSCVITTHSSLPFSNVNRLIT